jgi:hypothetical protein
VSALDLLVDGFPHGTKAGYDGGCRTANCPAPLACRDFVRRYAGDFAFRRLIDAGMTAADVIALEHAEADTAAERQRAADVSRREQVEAERAAARQAERDARLEERSRSREEARAAREAERAAERERAAEALAASRQAERETLRAAVLEARKVLRRAEAALAKFDAGRKQQPKAHSPAPAPRATRVPGSAFTAPVREPRPPRVPSAPREIKPHGTNASYTRGCKSKTDCPNLADGGMSCYEAHLEYHRNYDRSRRTRGADGHHGTAYGYQLGCRGECPADPSCTAVMLEADRNRPSRADRPKRGPMVDSGPVIAHIESLRAAGMPMLTIVERTGLRKFVQTLIYGRPGGERKGQIPKRVDAVKAATVMAVRADSELTRKAG